jgi:hypothetical protein
MKKSFLGILPVVLLATATPSASVTAEPNEVPCPFPTEPLRRCFNQLRPHPRIVAQKSSSNPKHRSKSERAQRRAARRQRALCRG